MKTWGPAIFVLGAIAVGLLGILTFKAFNKSGLEPAPAPVAPVAPARESDELALQQVELERERLAVEALRLKAQIQSDLAKFEMELREQAITEKAEEEAEEEVVGVGVGVAEVSDEPDMAAADLDPAPPSMQHFEPDPVAYNDFYEPLQAYGDWYESVDYGPVWSPGPAYIDDGWAPYTYGSWGYSDYGWSWRSDEPFGWACYHYGRWIRLHGRGWCWVPGRDWAPAWVSWRTCDTHIAWAPLPPCARWNRSLGIGIWVDAYCGIGPSSYCFVKRSDFGARDCRRVRVKRERNYDLIRITKNVTRVSYTKNVVHNYGPEFDRSRKLSSNPIPRVKVTPEVEARGKIKSLVSTTGAGKKRTALKKLEPTARPDRGWGKIASGKGDPLRVRQQVLAEARGALIADEDLRTGRSSLVKAMATHAHVRGEQRGGSVATSEPTKKVTAGREERSVVTAKQIPRAIPIERAKSPSTNDPLVAERNGTPSTKLQTDGRRLGQNTHLSGRPTSKGVTALNPLRQENPRARQPEAKQHQYQDREREQAQAQAAMLERQQAEARSKAARESAAREKGSRDAEMARQAEALQRRKATEEAEREAAAARARRDLQQQNLAAAKARSEQELVQRKAYEAAQRKAAEDRRVAMDRQARAAQEAARRRADEDAARKRADEERQRVAAAQKKALDDQRRRVEMDRQRKEQFERARREAEQKRELELRKARAREDLKRKQAADAARVREEQLRRKAADDARARASAMQKQREFEQRRQREQQQAREQQQRQRELQKAREQQRARDLQKVRDQQKARDLQKAREAQQRQAEAARQKQAEAARQQKARTTSGRPTKSSRR